MPKRKRNFRWAKWLLFLLLIAGAVAVVILVKNNYFDKKDEKSSSQAVETNKTEDKKPEEKAEQKNDKKENSSEPEQKVPQYEGESPNKSETLTGLITYADVVNDELVIRANIDQFLQSGSCNLKITRNGATHYSKSVRIVESVTTSTCDGFKIPVSELPSGNLQVEIDLESDGKSGKIEGRVKI